MVKRRVINNFILLLYRYYLLFSLPLSRYIQTFSIQINNIYYRIYHHEKKKTYTHENNIKNIIKQQHHIIYFKPLQPKYIQKYTYIRII